MSDFQREERYIVVKLADLAEADQKDLRRYLSVKDIRTRECVVVEPDWEPIYEETWANVERYAAGRPSIGQEHQARGEELGRDYVAWADERDAMAAKVDTLTAELEDRSLSGDPRAASEHYWQAAEILQPHIDAGTLPASVVDSVSVLLEAFAERVALAAYVERLREGYVRAFSTLRWSWMRDLLDETPETSLARIIAQAKAEALKSAALEMGNSEAARFLMERAAKIERIAERRQAEDMS